MASRDPWHAFTSNSAPRPRDPRPPAGFRPGTKIGTGYGLAGKGDVVQIRLDTNALKDQLRGSALRVGGAAWDAMKAAHEEMGTKVAAKALENLETRLIKARRSVNSRQARNRGIRAALRDRSNIIVDSYGRFWGVGDPRVFDRYKALDYYRVIERGGGFRGRVFGLLLDAEGLPTKGPTKFSKKQRQQMTSQRNTFAKAYNDLNKRKKAGLPRPGGMAKYNTDLAGIRRQIESLQSRAKDGYVRHDDTGRKVMKRTGQPLKDWAKYGGSAAASVAGSNGPGGYWFVVRNQVQPKRYLTDALTDFMNSGMPEEIYNRHFRRAGVPFRYVRGTVREGWPEEASRVADFWKEHTTQLGSVARHSG